MVQTIAAILRDLKQALGLQQSLDLGFFPEWQQAKADLSEANQHLLDRVKANFLALMEDPPMLENTVKMVILSQRRQPA